MIHVFDYKHFIDVHIFNLFSFYLIILSVFLQNKYSMWFSGMNELSIRLKEQPNSG